MGDRFHVAVERRVRQRIELVVEADNRTMAAAVGKQAALNARSGDAWREISDETDVVGTASTDKPLGPIGDLGGTDRLRDFFDNDAEFQGFYAAQMETDAPIGIVVDDRGVMHFANAGRDEFASVSWSVDAYVVTHTNDPMKLLDPEADVYHRGSFADLRDAVVMACETVGYDYGLDATPAP